MRNLLHNFRMFIYNTEEYVLVIGEVVLILYRKSRLPSNILRELGAPLATALVAALLASGGNPGARAAEIGREATSRCVGAVDPVGKD